MATPRETRRTREDARRRAGRIRRALIEQRRELAASLRQRLSSVREDRRAADHVTALDDGEVCDLDVQEDIELALMQLKRDALAHFDAALARLDSGLYGRCSECGDDIAEARLRALPFAVRCTHCEEAHESDERRAQMGARRQPRGSDVLAFSPSTRG